MTKFLTPKIKPFYSYKGLFTYYLGVNRIIDGLKNYLFLKRIEEKQHNRRQKFKRNRNKENRREDFITINHKLILLKLTIRRFYYNHR